MLHYDIAFVPLINRIYGSVPSKIFEYARLGLPLLYYAGGEGAAIVDQHQLGWVCPAGNLERLQALLDGLSRTEVSRLDRKEIREKAEISFNLQQQFDELATKVMSV